MPQDNGADVLRRCAAFLGVTGVAAGAFGAHALKDVLNSKGAMKNWCTAVAYQLFHAAAVLGVAAIAGGEVDEKYNSKLNLGGKLMTVGTLMFSGSIYCLCLGMGPKRILRPTTPIGGLFLIEGWFLIGV